MLKPSDILFMSCLVIALVAAACTPQQAADEQQADATKKVKKTPKPPDERKDWRSEAERGQGGAFRFAIGDKEYTTDWGYADFEWNAKKKESTIFMMSNPAGDKELFPKMRLSLQESLEKIEDFVGKTFESKSLRILITAKAESEDREERRQGALKGAVRVTVQSADSEWIAGSFEGQTDDGEAITGTFRAKMNIVK